MPSILFWSHFWIMFLSHFYTLRSKDQHMFFGYILSYLLLFVSYFGYLKIVENNTSVEYNFGENSDCEGYNNEDIGDNESKVPVSDPIWLNIKVSLVGSSKVCSNHADCGEEWDDNGPNTVSDASVTVHANIPNWTTNFTDIAIESFTQDSDPSLTENIDGSVTIAFFKLLFKPEIFSDIRGITQTTMSSSNKNKFGKI